jgi:hypothetical protein
MKLQEFVGADWPEPVEGRYELHVPESGEVRVQSLDPLRVAYGQSAAFSGGGPLEWETVEVGSNGPRDDVIRFYLFRWDDLTIWYLAGTREEVSRASRTRRISPGVRP